MARFVILVAVAEGVADSERTDDGRRAGRMRRAPQAVGPFFHSTFSAYTATITPETQLHDTDGDIE
ncbi:hypothetical protein HJFPF1_11406 [Paramyrothecium foliicola]|nr:hypothetical protein HJFPF1_11406 [Paramyrothecium foliicola]